ncbi:peptide deformylase [bacterium]|nr:peptide deformylase [candidate division CSSED10-310 bacterium]
MTKRIYTYGASVLREKALPIEAITAEIRELAASMMDTMLKAPGIGLAAPQVGVSLRMIIVTYGIDVEKPDPRVIINPEIIWHSDEMESAEEGCLSVPDETGFVPRWSEIRIRGMTLDGDEFEELLIGWTARIFQHETDHLDGILFVDRLSFLKRDMVKRRLKKRLKSEVNIL